jgi:iron complex outermembrane receptor protein
MTNTGARTYVIGWNGTNAVNQHAYRAKGEYAINSSTILTLQYMLTRYYWVYSGYETFLRDSSGAAVSNGTVTLNDGGVTRVLKVTPNAFAKSGPGGQYNHIWTATLQHKLSSRDALRIDAGYVNVPNYNYRTPASTATIFDGPGTRNFTVRRRLHANVQYNHSAGRHNLVAGGETDGASATNYVFSMNNWAIPENLVAQTYLARGRAVNQSAYVQDQISLSDRLSLVVGGRFDYWKTYNGLSNGFSTAAPETVYPGRSQNSLTGKAALTYSLGADLLLRASAGTAFRSPGIYELYATSVISGITYAGNPTLVPEHARSWEAGAKKRLGEWTSLDVSYYENRIRDMIYRTSDLTIDPSGSYRVNRNAGEQRTRGLEIAVDQRILRWLRFRGVYNFADAIITKNPAVPATVGKRALYIPRNSASGQLLGSRGRWSGSATARYVGETFNSDLNTDATRGVFTSYDPYFTVEANLACRLSRHLEVYVNGENLLNRHYYLYHVAPGRSATGGVRIRL